MMPSPHQPLIISAALTALLAGCGGQSDGLADRPRAKPDQVTVAVADPNQEPGQLPITVGRVSTKSGEMLILDRDGSVSTVQLDSAEGRRLMARTDAQMAALRDGNSAAWQGVVAKGVNRQGPSAQEQALEEFQAQSGPLLPEPSGDAPLDPADFLGLRIARISPEEGGDLVEVSANLREGVDADTAFSYATCALARWAEDQGTPYARHIRTVQDQRGGKLLISAAYMLSDQQPVGLRVMKTNDTLRECKDRGIPAA